MKIIFCEKNIIQENEHEVFKKLLFEFTMFSK